jgi:phosphate transport system protein
MTERLTNEQLALNNLKNDIEEMMEVVLTQLTKAQESYINCDGDLAQEILTFEKKINSLDLRLDKLCESILALYHPLAANLRYTLAVMSISTQLERIADHAAGIAEYIDDGYISEPMSEEILKKVQFNVMFETAISMIDDAIYSFINEDTKIVKWVFGKDKTLNKINKESSNVIAGLCKKNPDKIKQLLYLFSIMKKLERIGDLAKNIVEETVFYVDAKNIKHKKKKKYMP